MRFKFMDVKKLHIIILILIYLHFKLVNLGHPSSFLLQLLSLLISSTEVSMDLSEEESAPLMIRDRGGSQRSSSSAGHSLQVHLYFFPATKDATTINISGPVSAENVCIQAAKKCGKLSLTGSN